jgi:hypothetical protein
MTVVDRVTSPADRSSITKMSLAGAICYALWGACTYRRHMRSTTWVLRSNQEWRGAASSRMLGTYCFLV